ncbi:tRNA (cytidine(34)-2'-O)-methyltransferase [Oricola indica]|jgi:tRNA (cytidine/uridine-2'-O-)-methyltransferase|uniref:tRNA (cytidine(34)-2'-O)-methyltransferase n=1 Tax=Oricola indica TaxID=2872591 RepID=UPI001CBAC8B3|nr:tRNA (cytidine(34)-2'-O)-methyltransferase [Oricola indica]
MTDTPTLHIALYQPDIPGNTGAILRLAACLGAAVHVIEPAGFDLSDRALKRAGMDYLEMATMHRHLNWEAFDAWRTTENRRLVLLTTQASAPYTAHEFRDYDILLFGRESVGVPDAVHDAADIRLTIPMAEGARSINLALSAAMVAGEAMRQLAWQP